MKRHGGFIDVKSEIGKGSTFTVFLPAANGPLPSENENIEKEHKGSGTILVMDDQEIIRLTVGRMFETLGYRVVFTEDGASAVEYFEKNRSSIEAMMFDLTIPGGMGGLEAVSKIREIDKYVPVFVSSGYADDPVMADPQKYGFTASISKPFTKAELIRVLNGYMGNK